MTATLRLVKGDARPNVLVAGIGNVYLGDDGFGVEVVRRVRAEGLVDGADVADFGIRSVHLAFELADGPYDAAILVDALPLGGPPGTLYAIEPDAGAEDVALDSTRGLTPAAVIAWLRRVGGRCERIVIVGCEPACVDERMELSKPVAASVDEAIRMIRDLVAEIQRPAVARNVPCA